MTYLPTFVDEQHSLLLSLETTYYLTELNSFHAMPASSLNFIPNLTFFSPQKF